MTGQPRQPARTCTGTTTGKNPGKSAAAPVPASGRHPDAERTVVRFTDAALGDLELMARKGDPQVVRWALKKCLLLERDPEAGEPLRGALIGYRKLAVGYRKLAVGTGTGASSGGSSTTTRVARSSTSPRCGPWAPAATARCTPR